MATSFTMSNPLLMVRNCCCCCTVENWSHVVYFRGAVGGGDGDDFGDEEVLDDALSELVLGRRLERLCLARRFWNQT